MVALASTTLRQQAPTLPDEASEQKLLDSLLLEHKSHPSNYFASHCRVCQFNAAYHIERQDKDAAKAKQCLSRINSQSINTAIEQVNKALGEQLVQPFESGVEA